MLFAVTAALAAVMTLASSLAWQHLGPAADTYARMAADLGYGNPARLADEVRWSLGYNVAVTVGTALVAGVLALLVRQPLRWAQVAGWCAATAIALGLGFGLVTGSATAGARPDSSSSAFDRLDYDLLPQWYPITNAVLGLALLVAVVAAGVLLLRSSVSDFYRAESRQEDDPRWANFIEKQKRGLADESSP
jgi:hypothetical protein